MAKKKDYAPAPEAPAPKMSEGARMLAEQKAAAEEQERKMRRARVAARVTGYLRRDYDGCSAGSAYTCRNRSEADRLVAQRILMIPEPTEAPNYPDRKVWEPKHKALLEAKREARAALKKKLMGG